MHFCPLHILLCLFHPSMRQLWSCWPCNAHMHQSRLLSCWILPETASWGQSSAPRHSTCYCTLEAVQERRSSSRARILNIVCYVRYRSTYSTSAS
ncbi:hypothetical protein F5Y07DRAFT_274694 [Xylaria sp. FL0933]|nr:hypothetical protein F5Y07DRAFT_274694 [Xylaria sp. FL0933]